MPKADEDLPDVVEQLSKITYMNKPQEKPSFIVKIIGYFLFDYAKSKSLAKLELGERNPTATKFSR